MRFLPFLLFIAMLFFSGCMVEAEPNEFAQMRKNMEKRQNEMFANSVENLEKRKQINPAQQNVTEVVDPQEKLRLEQEAEQKRWAAVNIEKEEAEDWKALNLSPKHALRWKKTGLSYNTISVLIKEDVSPSEATEFMNKTFSKTPKAFAVFAQPLYEFKASCIKIMTSNDEEFGLIGKKCRDYIQLSDVNAISGHLADHYKDNDLSLEYISKLRQLDSQKAYIQKLMEKKSHECMINGDTKNFTLLFTMIEGSPTKEEMFFVSKHRLPLKDTHRYRSHKFYAFWINKEKEEEKARVAAIRQQQELKEAKALRLKAEAYRLKAQAHNKMVASQCGEAVKSHPSTGEKVHIEGEILYLVGKMGTNVFAFVVKNSRDGKNYLIREPNTKRKVNKESSVSWTAVTVGRVVSVTIEEDGTASYNHYEDESKEYFPMLRFISECPHETMALNQ